MRLRLSAKDPRRINGRPSELYRCTAIETRNSGCAKFRRLSRQPGSFETSFPELPPPPRPYGVGIGPVACAKKIGGQFGYGLLWAFHIPKMLPATAAVVGNADFSLPSRKPCLDQQEFRRRLIAWVVHKDCHATRRSHESDDVACPPNVHEGSTENPLSCSVVPHCLAPLQTTKCDRPNLQAQAPMLPLRKNPQESPTCDASLG